VREGREEKRREPECAIYGPRYRRVLQEGKTRGYEKDSDKLTNLFGKDFTPAFIALMIPALPATPVSQLHSESTVTSGVNGHAEASPGGAGVACAKRRRIPP
jgi:hypothetical protein